MGAAPRWRIALAAAVLAAGLAQPAAGQYFGRNKVQYKTFRFEVLQTEHFDIYFYPEERAAVGLAAQMAERWYARLARVFTHQLTGRQPLVVYASHPDFEQTNVIEGELGEGTGGVTERLKRRIVLPLGASLAECDHVIGHELVHAFQFDIGTYSSDRFASGGDGLDRLPLWFVEGMAEYLSVGPEDALTAMWMRDAASRPRLPSVHDLANPRYFPYRWGQALWAYIAGRYGDEAVAALFNTAAVNGDAEGAVRVVLGIEPAELSRQWHAALAAGAATVRRETRPVSDIARPVARDPGELATYNLSPSISPDGRRMMFLSQRSLFSLDLFLADAATGRIVRKVVDASVNPHFSSLEAINSAGGWSPDGRRFALSAVHAGTARLAIVDADSGAAWREIPLPAAGEVFSPSWSPDGRSIVYSALHGGVTDLFVVDLGSLATRQLTDDAYADLQPVWSPDGREIAFVTDRFTTKLETCAPGPYRIALLDVSSGEIRAVRAAAEGKNINPQWASSGELLFVSDRTGISNVYRVSLPTGRLRQVTDVPTGVSGLTAISPAFSYAPGAGRLAFSLYENGRYSIFAVDDPQALEGRDPEARLSPDPARLPPDKREDGVIDGLRRNEEIGLAGARGATTHPYTPRLTIDAIAQPYVTAGVGGTGAFAGGGAAFLWSDLLGDYGLGAAFEVNGSYIHGWDDFSRSLGGQVTFTNRKHRWNYGLAAGQWPYLAGSLAIGVAESGGRPVGVEELTIYRQVERSVSGLALYPFNAAERLELSGGVSNITFDQHVETMTFDLGSGMVLTDDWKRLPAPEPLTLGRFSAAFVHDTVLYGATSPVSGQGFRLQVSPTVGTLKMANVLADYRRYVMPVPFYTLAGRVLHFGRYGPGAEDPRLVPLYVGNPTLVRGYDINSFGESECTPTPDGSCAELDRLLGSRLLVGNLEWRFPLLRPLGVRPGMYGPVPMEIAVFADAGVAWYSGERPAMFGGRRRAVSSAGVALRVRMFDLLVLEFDVSKPFQRPGRGAVFQLTIAPGF